MVSETRRSFTHRHHPNNVALAWLPVNFHLPTVEPMITDHLDTDDRP
jgi:hypothetical protein